MDAFAQVPLQGQMAENYRSWTTIAGRSQENLRRFVHLLQFERSETLRLLSGRQSKSWAGRCLGLLVKMLRMEGAVRKERVGRGLAMRIAWVRVWRSAGVAVAI